MFNKKIDGWGLSKVVLLVEEIMHHLGCNLENSGTVSISTGQGFLSINPTKPKNNHRGLEDTPKY